MLLRADFSLTNCTHNSRLQKNICTRQLMLVLIGSFQKGVFQWAAPMTYVHVQSSYSVCSQQDADVEESPTTIYTEIKGFP